LKKERREGQGLRSHFPAIKKLILSAMYSSWRGKLNGGGVSL